MEINILQLLEGAKEATGLTVIIDVFRAFSTTCYAFNAGAIKIIPIGEIEKAYKLKEINPDYILVGERNEQKPPGFDFGNSPSQLLNGNLAGKTIVHTTSSGTQGIANAKNADEIITGSFVNAGAIVKYIQQKQPKKVSLVCMGYACEYPTDEDTLCAEWIKNELKEAPLNLPKWGGTKNKSFAEMVKIIRQGSGARFFDPEKQDWSPQADFELCVDLNRFDFVLKVEKEGELNYLRKIAIQEMRKYNFDEIVSREGTNCLKYDARERFFGNSDVLPLWVADMDFKTPDFIIDAIKKRLEHEILGYTFRCDSYYQSIIDWMKRRHNWEIQREWISFSPGVVAGLTFGIEAFSKPGDGVVVQPPVYFPFFDSVKGTKRKMIENPLKIENGRYTFDFDDLKAKIDETTKLLLLCNPQNPGGMVWTKEELTELTTICLENKIMIISDEIHSDLIFEGKKHIPLASLSDEIAQNCMITMAPSKTFNVAGLSSSVVIVPNKTKFARFERAIGVPHLHMGNIFGTIAMEAAYTHGDEWLKQMLQYLWENYLLLEDFFKTRLPKVKVMKPEATYLIWLDFREYGMKNEELMKFTVENARVGLNDGGRFGTGGDGWLRINIGCPRSILTEALERLGKAFG